MAEELQLEISSRIYAAHWSSLERIAQFFKTEYEGKTKLAVAKHVAQQLEEGIGKLEATEVVPYLEDVKKLVTEKPSLASRAKSVLCDSKPPTIAKEDSIQKLLATSALRRQFKISGQIGEPEQKDKISFSSLARQIQTWLAQGYVESEIVEGVIRSITPGMVPGMVLRGYLETHKDLTLDRLKKMLRSHYGVKNTAELYQTLASLCQSPRESPQAF